MSDNFTGSCRQNFDIFLKFHLVLTIIGAFIIDVVKKHVWIFFLFSFIDQKDNLYPCYWNDIILDNYLDYVSSEIRNESRWDRVDSPFDRPTKKVLKQGHRKRRKNGMNKIENSYKRKPRHLNNFCSRNLRGKILEELGCPQNMKYQNMF